MFTQNFHSKKFSPKKFHPKKCSLKKCSPNKFSPKKIFTQTNFPTKIFFTESVRLSFVDLRWAQLYVSLVFTNSLKDPKQSEFCTPQHQHALEQVLVRMWWWGQTYKILNYKIQKIQMCRLTGQDHQRRPRQQAQCSRRRGQRGSGRRTLGHTRPTAHCASLLATAPCSLHLQYCTLLLNVFSLEWATTAKHPLHTL